ncbi:MAG TPA: GNAT family N-acetyltransferase [Vicinamibacterales bacterium]|nr:GNAT family N-acetyltransferase [Vicinamibacterales bacterium]
MIDSAATFRGSSSPEYRIRLGAPEDIGSLAEVEREASTLFQNHFTETGLTGELLLRTSAEEDLRDAQQAGRLWVAVTRDGEVVGFASASEVGDYANLDELDVLPAHGRLGLGSRLLAEVCAWACGAGYPAVTLSTFREVPWNAPFYQRRGFEPVAPDQLSSAYAARVAAEARRGLRTDLRVVMAYRIGR